MESLAVFLVLSLYFLCLAVLSGYGLHRWYLLALYLRYRRRAGPPPANPEVWPLVTVQVPLYNEMYVAKRIIEAVCNFDYPRDRLDIQILDDSTDETQAIAAAEVDLQRRAGVTITHLHRTLRTGFKAGALQAGLGRARGDLVAVFDADFVPPPNFLREVVPQFADARIGMVQTRWGHLNRDYSALTRVQALLLDGHFVIEHTARHRSGRFFNFNGTAGVWRRACIDDAGGWQSHTLTEDLDLSYRAQLQGWRFVYLPQVQAPAELPVEMGSFKSQQHRWAKGSIQTARKLLPNILRSNQPLAVKAEAIFHLTANVGYVLMAVLALLVVPTIWLRRGINLEWMFVAVDLPLFALSTLSIAGFYAVAHREATGSFRGIGRMVPFLMAMGIGLCLNNARAVIEAATGRLSEFRRTPKYNLSPGEGAASRRYRGVVGRDVWIETALAVYFAVALVAVMVERMWTATPFLALFELGFGYTALTSLVQARRRSAPVERPDPSLAPVVAHR